jgi:hypothetical protein
MIAWGGLDGMMYQGYGGGKDKLKVVKPDFPLSEVEYEGIEVEDIL